MTIKAIETVYNGYRFRSRLEARWAVFFDAAGIDYEYEKEGFDLDASGKYLPDFYLPQYGTWVEIKPYLPLEQKIYLAGKMKPNWRESLPLKGCVVTGPDMKKIIGDGDGLNYDRHAYCPDVYHGAREYHDEVVRECFQQISDCDSMFVWLSGMNPYGTLVEMGYAKAIGKPIYIATNEHSQSLFVDGLTVNVIPDFTDMWFALSLGHEVMECQTPWVAFELLMRTLKKDRDRWEKLSIATKKPITILRGEPHPDRFSVMKFSEYAWSPASLYLWDVSTKQIMEALSIALQSRFEHGETPRIQAVAR